MVHRRACIQGVLKVTVDVKGHVLQAIFSYDENRSSPRQMPRSPPNLHTMVPRWACIQDVLKVKVEVKGHVIRALYVMGALQGEPSGPWPTQNFVWVGHNAFGPTNNWPVCSLVIAL